MKKRVLGITVFATILFALFLTVTTYAAMASVSGKPSEIEVKPGHGTLQAAIDSANPGDVLLLEGNEQKYYGDVVIDKDITIKGKGMHTSFVFGKITIKADKKPTVKFQDFGMNFSQITEANYKFINVQSPVDLSLTDVRIWYIARPGTGDVATESISLNLSKNASGSNVKIDKSFLVGLYNCLNIESSNTDISITKTEISGQLALRLANGSSNKVSIDDKSEVVGRSIFSDSRETIEIAGQTNLNLNVNDSILIGNKISDYKPEPTNLFLFTGNPSSNVKIRITGNSTVNDCVIDGSSLINFGKQNTPSNNNSIYIAGTVKLSPSSLEYKYNHDDDYAVVGIYDVHGNLTAKTYALGSIISSSDLVKYADGYDIRGWYKDATFKEEYKDEPIKANMDIYPKYVRKLKVNIGDSLLNVYLGETLSQTEGGVEALNALKDESKEFSRFVDSKGNTFTEDTPITDDTTITAKYMENITVGDKVFELEDGQTLSDIAELKLALDKLTYADNKTFSRFVDENGNTITLDMPILNSMTISAKYSVTVTIGTQKVVLDEGSCLADYKDLDSVVNKADKIFVRLESSEGVEFKNTEAIYKNMILIPKYNVEVEIGTHKFILAEGKSLEDLNDENVKIALDELSASHDRVFLMFVDEAGKEITESTPIDRNTKLIAKFDNIIKLNDITFNISNVDKQYYSGKEIKPEITLVHEGYTLKQGKDYTVSYANNLNVGTATITITGMGDYIGVITKTFEIDRKDMSEVTIDNVSQAEYRGAPIVQFPLVRNNGVNLSEGKDYTVEYANNIDAGVATMTLNGIGNYTGSISKTFIISKKYVSFLKIENIVDKEFTGQEIKQDFKITYPYTTLVLEENKDYTVTYSNNVNIGTAKIRITGMGNFTGYVDKEFKITPKDINVVTVGGIQNKEFTGYSLTQDIVVKDGDKELLYGKDYTVWYGNNVNAGTASINISGMGIYSGTITKYFNITAKDLSNFTVSNIVNKEYTGSVITQSLVVKDENTVLVSGRDYTVSYSNNVKTGSATITIKGIGNYTGTIIKTFKIMAKDTSKLVVNGISNKTYTGSSQKQSLVVKDGSKTLKEGTDYTVTYASNTNVGTAKVNIVGKGNYTGTVTKTFQITAKNTSKLAISGLVNKTYTGSSQKQSLVVKDGSKALKEGTDYTVSYSNNVNAGTAKVNIVGKGNYTGTVTKTFKITAKNTSKFAVSGIANKTYTGSSQKQSLVVKDGSKTLSEGKDFVVSYSNNTNVGTAKLTITGKGNYTGSAQKSFKITAKNASKLSITGVVNKTYTGSNLKQNLTVKDNSKKLNENKDYTVNYTNNKNTGTAKVTVTGKGNYTGSAQKNFTILPGTVSKLKATKQMKNEITLGWANISGASGYEVYKYNTSKKVYEYIGSTVKPSFASRGLKAGTNYQYKVRAYKTIGGTKYFGNYSAILTVSTKLK